jgi:hypothetical protein
MSFSFFFSFSETLRESDRAEIEENSHVRLQINIISRIAKYSALKTIAKDENE